MSAAVLLLLLGMSCMFLAVAFIVFLNLNKQGTTPGTGPGTGPGTTPGTGTGGGGDGAHIKNGTQLFAQIEANAKQLQAHLRKKHANHPNTKSLERNFRSLAPMPQTADRGRFWGLTIGTRVEIRVHDRWHDLKGTNNTLLHELGHTLSLDETADHGPKFREKYMWLADIASRELGWRVEPGCGICRQYKICDQTACPRCLWCSARVSQDAWLSDLPAQASSLMAQ